MGPPFIHPIPWESNQFVGFPLNPYENALMTIPQYGYILSSFDNGIYT